MSNVNRSALSALSSTNFPDNTTQEISPADLRAWLSDAIDSFVTQKDKSTLENALYEAEGGALAASATVNLASATGNFLHITGSATINSFGICPAGARFVLVFDGACTLTYNAVSLIIPGSTDLTTVANDTAMIISEGGGNWRIVNYYNASGIGLGTVTQVDTGTGLTGGPITTTGTISIASISPDPSGSYTNANITVNAQGQVTAATNGSPGGVTSVTATTPLASSGGSTPDISIPQASATQDGYLDNADWSTFNGKQDAITLTTSGSSGAATLIGSTLNIPNYSGGSGTVQQVDTAGLISGGPITSTGTISTSMATQKLVGRYTSGTGIMEEVSVGSGLTLTGAGVLNNTATPTPTGYYAMYQDVLTQTAAVNNTGYPMKFRTMDLSNQVTVVSDSRITFANAGIYNLQFSSQFQNTDNAQHDITIWLRLNNVDVTGSAGFVQIPARKGAGAGNEGHLITSWNYLLSVAAGDYYEIIWSTSDATNVTMQFYPAGSPPPSTASTIFTVTQQAGIMAGTGITGMVGTTGPTQTGATQTLSSTDMTITSSSNTHTFAIPSASDTTKGLITTGNQTLAGIKTFGNGVNPGELRLLEGSGSGSNYVSIKAPSTLAADYTLTLPTDDGVASQVLQTDGTGGLSWASIGAITGLTRIAVTTPGTTILNTNVNTKTQSVLIPANTFGAGSIFSFFVWFVKPSAGGNSVFRVYVNTSDAIGGIQVAQTGTVTTQNWAKLERDFVITNSTTDTSGYIGTVSLITDVTNVTQAGIFQTSAIDWTINQYFVVGIQNPTTVGEQAYCKALSILKK
jgi:hypothetical protein